MEVKNMKNTWLIIFLALTLTAIAVAQTQQTKFGSVTRAKESEQNKATPIPTPISTPQKPKVKVNTGSESNVRKGSNPSSTPSTNSNGGGVKLFPRPTPTPSSDNIGAVPTPTPTPNPTPVIKKVVTPTPTPTPAPVVDYTPVWQKFATEAEVRSHNVLSIGNGIITSYQKNNEHVAEDTLKSSGCPDTDLRCTYLASYLVKKSLNSTTRKFADKQVNKFLDRFTKREAPKSIGISCVNCETEFRNLQVAASISIALDPNSKRSKKIMNQLGYFYTMRFVDSNGKTTREPNLLSASECLLSGDDEKTFQIVRLEKNFKITEIK